MKKILVIKHIDIEGPGNLEVFLRKNGHSLKIIDLSEGDDLPASFKDISAVISLGGPMNVYEEDKYPFLKKEDEFIKKTLREKIPFLGICLGAQLLAKARGARVRKNKVKEIGWYKIKLTGSGRRDRFFSGVPENFDCFEWHEDTFDIPEKLERLAESPDCANQAFRMGENAYGLQFHVEVTPEMIESWIRRYGTIDDEGVNLKNMLAASREKKHLLEKETEVICRNFSKIIKGENT